MAQVGSTRFKSFNTNAIGVNDINRRPSTSALLQELSPTWIFVTTRLQCRKSVVFAVELSWYMSHYHCGATPALPTVWAPIRKQRRLIFISNMVWWYFCTNLEKSKPSSITMHPLSNNFLDWPESQIQSSKHVGFHRCVFVDMFHLDNQPASDVVDKTRTLLKKPLWRNL